jgi:pimeloyl-ACP methyl ester carboxylesterase
MAMKRDPAAIFIHGAGGGGWEWTIWQRVFTARNWSVLAPDLMPTFAGIVATRFEDYAAQTKTWCEAVAEPYVLIGASLGGLLALHASVRPAARVLINPLPPADIGGPPASEYPDVVFWGRARSLASTRRAMLDADHAATVFAFRRWRDESGTVLNAAHRIQVETPPCPMLILASEADMDVPLASSRVLAARLHAEFRVVPGASHLGPLLGREAAGIAEATLAWCDQVIAAQASR